jgi:hypothetical protein
MNFTKRHEVLIVYKNTRPVILALAEISKKYTSQPMLKQTSIHVLQTVTDSLQDY